MHILVILTDGQQYLGLNIGTEYTYLYKSQLNLL